MFEYVSPESVGIPSKKLLEILKNFEAHGFCTHSIIMARGNKIFAEMYHKPFHKDYCHRMYSVSKSFVGVAIGLLEEDGLLTLDDKLLNFFPEYDNESLNQNIREQTIRDMLKMSTCVRESFSWFGSGTDDRASLYFKYDHPRIPGTTYCYDSPGSFMLGAIVEKLTGKPFLEYMKDKFLRAIGFSEEATCLKCPGGYSWGDSAILCSSVDLLKFARFVMNKGEWDGVRYMNKEFLEAATSKQVDNNIKGIDDDYGTHGYGYQIWKTPGDGFAFVGMGDQFAICDPEHDFIFIINSDNQFSTMSRPVIYDMVFNKIIPNLGDALPEDETAKKELEDYINTRELYYLRGRGENPFRDEIDGVTYVMDKNPMGIEYIRFDFEGDKGVLSYKNEQGEKKLAFGFGHNEFGKFPQEGYSDLIGTYKAEGNMYDCAVSGEWSEDKKLKLKVQIIDKYFGNSTMTFSFKDSRIAVCMMSNAEAFLKEYQGYANGRRA